MGNSSEILRKKGKMTGKGILLANSRRLTPQTTRGIRRRGTQLVREGEAMAFHIESGTVRGRGGGPSSVGGATALLEDDRDLQLLGVGGTIDGKGGWIERTLPA